MVLATRTVILWMGRLGKAAWDEFVPGGSLISSVQVLRSKGYPHRVGKTMSGVGVSSASLVRKRGYRGQVCLVGQVYLWMYGFTA